MKEKAEWMAEVANATRLIGIVPRVKAKADQKPSPTTMAIYDCGTTIFWPKFALDDEQSELDFVLGYMPIKWRGVAPDEDLSGFKEEHHIRMKKDPADRKKLIPDQVPCAYESLRKGDVVAMALGGSGDNFAFALSRKAEEIGALVLRCPPFRLKAFREHLATRVDPENAVLDDSFVLAKMVKEKPDDFYPVFVRERNLTWLRECYRRRIDCMKARIACEQRLRQRFIGQLFCSAEGRFPEGAIEKVFDQIKTSDVVLTSLSNEEASADKALEKACKALPVYTEVFGQITGVGPSIASRLIAGIQDIRRFETKWKLRKFCGVHCNTDGSFPRARRLTEGEKGTGKNSWNRDCRQALFILGDQFNRRPGTEWGAKLLENKAFYRGKYPAPVEVKNSGGKAVKKYTDGHIHKMALWKTLGEFVEWLFEAWWTLEKAQQES